MAGGALGSVLGPLGSAAGSFLGGFVGAMAGNWFASRCADGVLGGVDLGGTLHFIDQLPVLDGVMMDPVSGFVAAASEGHVDGSEGHFADLSLHDLAVLLKVEFFNQGRATFSLDAFDPMDPFGEYQKKACCAKKSHVKSLLFFRKAAHILKCVNPARCFAPSS